MRMGGSNHLDCVIASFGLQASGYPSEELGEFAVAVADGRTGLGCHFHLLIIPNCGAGCGEVVFRSVVGRGVASCQTSAVKGPTFEHGVSLHNERKVLSSLFV